MTSVTLEKQGRRYYFRGDTYSVRDRLRSAGCKWDYAARAWYTGKQETADQLLRSLHEAPPLADGATAPAPTPRAVDVADDTKILGKAEYKGRTYLLLWEGTTRRGEAAKLASMDGKLVFWASAGDYRISKTYQERECRGRHEAMTFGRLRRLREDFAKAKADGNDDGIRNGQRYECEECGEWVTRGVGSCWETGGAH